MKTIYFFLVIFIPATTLYAQSSPSDKLFQKISSKDGVTVLCFSKHMLDLVNMDWDDDTNITGDIDQIKIMIYNASGDSSPMNFHQETLKYLSGRYKEVRLQDCDSDEDDEDIDIRVLRSGKRIKECHIILGDKDDPESSGLMISFFGNFKINDIKELADKAEKYE